MNLTRQIARLGLTISAMILMQNLAGGAPAPQNPKVPGKTENPIIAQSKQAEKLLASLTALETLPDNEVQAKQQMQRLFALRKGAPKEIAENISYATAAGLVSAGANIEYSKMKSSLPSVGTFQEQFLDPCKSCQSTGKKQEKCKDCKGSGNCPIPTCKDGMRMLPTLGGQRPMAAACPTCNGTGACPHCEGTGQAQLVCPFCVGSGKIINRDSARQLFKKYMEATIADCKTMIIVPIKASGLGAGETDALRAAIKSAIEQVHGPAKANAAMGSPGGIENGPYVKNYKIAAKPGITDEGLTEVKVGVFVAKYPIVEGSTGSLLPSFDF